MRKLTRAPGFLLTILALTVALDANAQVTANQSVVGQARSANYNLTRKGFKGFTATIEPNWEVILAHTATPENLKVFRAMHFSMIVDPNGAVTVSYEAGANAARPELQSVMKQIHYDLQRLVTGFFNTWRMFMVSSPFPETENQIKIETPDKQYRLNYTMQSGEVMLMMTSDFLITEWILSGPTATRTIKPHFQKTVDGFLLSGYGEVSQPISAGIKTTLEFNIEYQDVSGIKLPHKVRFSGMHGTEPVAAELLFKVTGD
jgi:hypothetical protein